MHDDSFANTSDVSNNATDSAPTKPVNPWRNRNRPTPTRNPLDVRHARTYDAQDAPPHRFDFW
jgi:hypothetical protein